MALIAARLNAGRHSSGDRAAIGIIIISLFSHRRPSLISLTVSVNVKPVLNWANVCSRT